MTTLIWDANWTADTPSDQGGRRCWKTRLDSSLGVQRLRLNGNALEPFPRAGDIVIVHGQDPESLNLLLRAVGEVSVAVIDVSGQHRRPTETLDARVYQRCAAVGVPVDSAFATVLVRFATHFATTKERQWDLLEPRCPEHVLACYVCTLGGVEPLPDWESGFINEVGYWRTGVGINTELKWEDRQDPKELRKFLLATQGLRETSTDKLPPEAPNDGR